MRAARRRCRTQKRRGDFSFEISPLLSDFSKTWFGAQITTDGHFGIVRSLRAELALPVLFRHSIRCESFPGPSRSSQFPECFASPVAGSPGVPFLVPLRVPFPVLLMALVYSLLLEDCSSAELKDTRDLPENHEFSQLFFCGNSADFVEIRPISRCFKG